MTILPASAAAWGHPDFPAVLKRELLALPAGTLPLHLGTSQGGIPDGRALDLTVLTTRGAEGHAVARVGVFFTEVVGGCSCGDDPYAVNGYCELEVRIRRDSGEAGFRPAPGSES
jgi:hypothetical protein